MSDKEVIEQENAARHPPEYIIQPGCDIRGLERMNIGKGVMVQRDCWLNIAFDNPDVKYMIELGDGTNIGRRCTLSAARKIVLGKNVLLGPNVFIADTNHQYKYPGIPVMHQGITTTLDEVHIGDGSWLGTNSVIVGNVKIGKGCVIGANSLVNSDIPDYCVAVGNPASIIKVYDTGTFQWVKVKSDDHLNELLSKRNLSKPLLSIGIATYNRAHDLDICLNSIYMQIGNDIRYEVVVSDNASTDNTEDVVNKYMNSFSTLKYFKNETNIGGDRNIFKVIGDSTGEFVLLHGDDDFFRAGTLPRIIDAVTEHRNCGLFFINVLNDDKKVKLLHGMNDFLKEASINSCFISSVMLNRSEYDKLEDPLKFIDCCFNQGYVQYSILHNNPDFCVINDSAFYYAGNPPKGYNFGEVFIRNYLTILNYFKDKGLSESLIKQDMHKILQTTVLYWFRRIIYEDLPLDVSNFEDIYVEFYKNEPYFEAAYDIIKKIRNKSL